MRTRELWSGLRGLALMFLVLGGSAAAVAAQSRDQSDYWRTKYQELKPTDDPRAATAHTIFQRLVQVAGQRPGVLPRLFITMSEPWDMALPIALRDGWIILSQGALEICYQNPARGEDRLAFVLAHEIAHQLNDDFWHLRFFEALKGFILWDSSTQEQVLAREWKADEGGILYA
ncbi:MAG TPA: hypothetical protein VIH59_08665, partial [Candidatus Tectomicrobia bacterium]